MNKPRIVYTMEVFLWRFIIKKDIVYYLYCTSGIRSRKTTELLSILGYKVINVKDGYKDKLL